MTDLSVIVPTWNAREIVSACLDALDEAVRRPGRLSLDVHVIDNGSEDDTVAWLRERHPWAEVEPLPANRGFAAAVNVGLAKAGGRHVVLLNNDTQVGPGALEACVAWLDAHPDVAVVGPQLLHADGRKQNSVHNEPGLATEILPHWLLELALPGRYPSKRYSHAEPFDVEAVLGACLVARTEAIRAVGPLCEDFFYFLEETDWCRRFRRAGWRVVHLPDVEVTHVHGATSKKRDPASTRIEYHRSLYRFFGKHRGPLVLAAVVGIRVLKSLLHTVVAAPAALVSAKGRSRWRARSRVLGWHLRGCPPGWGMRPIGPAT